MSQENVDALRECLEAFNRRDVEGMVRVMDPEIRFACQIAPLQGSYVGHEGIRDFFTDLAEVAADGRLELTEFRDLGDRVLALGQAHATAKASGVAMDGPLAVVATCERGRITEYVDFGNRSEALR